MSIRKGTNIIAGRSPYQPSLFDFKWADHILNDLSWIRSDTFIWYSKIKYDAAYNHLVADITGKEVQSETVDGIIITYYLANDGHKVCLADQEDYLNALYTKTGVAWYYLINTETQTFKLPRTKWGFTGMRGQTSVGDYIEAGLPNITGEFDNMLNGTLKDNGYVSGLNNVNTTGAFGRSKKANTDWHIADTNVATNQNGHYGANFDASRSSSIYGNSDTVQPQSTQMYLYFYVGEYTQGALENAAALNLEAVEEMVDTKLIDKQDVSTAVNYNNVSNCITEIPQDIKLELNDGTLTLKAGSKVYVPNGAGVFDEVVTENDVSATWGYNDRRILCYKNGTLGGYLYEDTHSGTTAPSSSQWMTWYDTVNNVVKQTSDGGSTWSSGWSLPICVVITGNGQFASIEQVFNGFGYIGQSVFSLPGIKGLIPNGRNADGILKNTEFTTTNVYVDTTFSLGNVVNNQVVAINSTGILWQNWIGEYDHEPAVVQYAAYYNSTTNKMYFGYSATEWTELSRAVAGFFSATTGGMITELNTKQSFRAVDYSEADFVVAFQKPTAANNYTWYRKYKSGWIEQGGEFTLTISAGNGNININLPVLMANGRYTALVNGGFISNVAFLKWNIVSRNTSYFNVSGDTGDSTSSGTTNTCCWQVSGMAAS